MAGLNGFYQVRNVRVQPVHSMVIKLLYSDESNIPGIVSLVEHLKCGCNVHVRHALYGVQLYLGGAFRRD